MATPVKIIEISFSKFTSLIFLTTHVKHTYRGPPFARDGSPQYVPGPPYVRNDSPQYVPGPPYVGDDTEHATIATTVGEEFPQGGVGRFIEECSKEDFEENPDEDMRDVSSQESHCQGSSKLSTFCFTPFAHSLFPRFRLVMIALGLGVSLSFAYVWVDLGSKYFVGTCSHHLLIIYNFGAYPHSMYLQFQTCYLLQ